MKYIIIFLKGLNNSITQAYLAGFAVGLSLMLIGMKEYYIKCLGLFLFIMGIFLYLIVLTKNKII
jgi:hypothetical protein